MVRRCSLPRISNDFYGETFSIPTLGITALSLVAGMVGGVYGIGGGARLQKFIPARRIKWLLAFCILFPAVKYIVGFFK